MNKRTPGIALILCSAFFFYLATLFVHFASLDFRAPGSWFNFSRFFLGLPFFYLFYRKHRVPVQNTGWLAMRAIFNVVAVIFFLYAAHFGSVMNANVLNMTYPAFVALLSPIFIGEKNSALSWIAVMSAISGAALITLRGQALHFSTADLLGLASGITAGVGVMSLRQIRKTDSTFNVLFFTFFLGTVVTAIWIFVEVILGISASPTDYPPRFWQLLLLSGFCGVAGQWVFTWGFAWVGAVEGSILSSSRILIALVAGVAFLGEPFTAASAIGAALVLFANVALALRPKH